MQSTKLVSVRLDEDDLNIIDKRAKGSGYRKRSDYINAAVRLMAWAIKERKEDLICKFYPCYGDVVDQFDLKFHRGHR